MRGHLVIVEEFRNRTDSSEDQEQHSDTYPVAHGSYPSTHVKPMSS